MVVLSLVEIDFIVSDCLDIISSLLNVVVKSGVNSAAHGLVGEARNLGSKNCLGNVLEPVS